MYFNAKAQKKKEEIHIFLCISSTFFQNMAFSPMGIVYKNFAALQAEFFNGFCIP